MSDELRDEGGFIKWEEEGFPEQETPGSGHCGGEVCADYNGETLLPGLG
jgi:hypothetical protein